MAKRLHTLHKRKERTPDTKVKRDVYRAVNKLGIEGADLLLDLIKADTPPQMIVGRLLPFALRERRRKEGEQ